MWLFKKVTSGRGFMAGPIMPVLVNLTLFSSIPRMSLGQARQEILKDILNNGTYDPKIAPNFNDNFPTRVMVQLFVLSIDSVDESAMGSDGKPCMRKQPAVTAGQNEWVSSVNDRSSSKRNIRNYRTMPLPGNGKQEYSMSIYLRQNWTDGRLLWSDHTNLTRIEVDTKLMDRVWTPDLYFVNEKQAIMHDVTVANKLLHLYPNGTVQSSIRISMTLSCDMYLHKYPHDQQTCSVNISSYSYTADNVVFKWHSTPVIMREGMTLPRFVVQYNSAGSCEFKNSATSMIVGNFSCITAEFELTRLFGYYIAQVYLPSVLIVMLSWVSFWIDIDAIPARVSLGLLTVLTMTTQSTGARNSLPRVSYVKAIDVWMAMCLGFVFAALLEFAYVNVQNRVERRRRMSVMEGNEGNGNVKEDSKFKNKELRGCENKISFSSNRRIVYLQDRLKRQRARMADKISRAMFPIMFFVFNIVYWLVYCL
ncbi:glycine receptor subunit alphaZ1-like isoform X2 [Haliotis rufescens]|uniref:glycine receptor subunit alphaZ1-like isoform X2 n=1 Tax=Haliotis rufescens TaxID=6454 RepID=UPI001EB04310|nr:glycine receptor subunit alphaZ1-like isoform X2 [Haliotis rufescens]